MTNPDDKKIIDQTIADYNLIAAKFSSTRLNITKDLIDLAGFIPQNATVLDYGCGNGRMADLFSSDKYLGVDPSVELIKIAKELHPNHKFQLIKTGDKVNQKFDAILCLAVIHHLPDHESQTQLINNLKSSLKHKGILILTAWNLEGELIQPDGLVHKPFKDGATTIDRPLYPFTLDKLKQLVQSTGFEVLTANKTPRNSGVYSNLGIIAKCI